MPFTAAEIAKQLGGEVIGDHSLVLTGFAPADRANLIGVAHNFFLVR